MKLSKRLQMSAQMVTKGHVVADIGCDHAYLSLSLIENGIAPRALAMDLRLGPLAKAKENIEKSGYGNQMETRLSNGLEKLSKNEADTILITGMGGELMLDILTKGQAPAATAKELILQPQSAIPLVRYYLHNKGFCIVSEDMCLEEGKFYTSIKAVPGKDPDYEEGSENSELFFEFGKLLLEQKHKILLSYLKREYHKKLKLREKLEASKTAAAKKRLPWVLKQMDLQTKAMGYF